MPEGERWCVDLVLFSNFLLVLDPPVFRIVLPENKTQTFTSTTTLYRKLETSIPRNKTAPPHSQLLHSCICERFIYSHDPCKACIFCIFLILGHLFFQKLERFLVCEHTLKSEHGGTTTIQRRIIVNTVKCKLVPSKP